MASINLLQKTPVFNADNQSYRLFIQVSSSQNITPNIFVKQRIANFYKNGTEDVFRAVATPAQLVDFGMQAPREGSSYFLDDAIDLTARDGDYLNEIAADVVNQVQELVDDMNALNVLSQEQTFTIT